MWASPQRTSMTSGRRCPKASRSAGAAGVQRHLAHPVAGAPSAAGEWEPLRPELVVEVLYDHVTGDRFRHRTKLLRFRPDKPPRQCSIDQIVAPPTRSLPAGGEGTLSPKGRCSHPARLARLRSYSAGLSPPTIHRSDRSHSYHLRPRAERRLRRVRPADRDGSSYRGSGRLAGRKALVTGGDFGMGRAAAIAFAREGEP